VGANKWTSMYSRLIEDVMRERCKIVAILDEDPRLRGRSICGHQVIGDVREIGPVVDEYAVHGLSIERVVVTGQKEGISQDAWAHLTRACAERGVVLEMLTERLALVEETTEEDIKRMPKPTLVTELAIIRARPYWRVKRVVDVL